MSIPFIDYEKINELLPMKECISVLEDTFRSLTNKTAGQPLRSIMWLPDKKGLMGMMPGYAMDKGIMGIKVISVFHGNRQIGLPSHQGIVMLMDAVNGKPLMLFDAKEITSIRTAAASAVAAKILANDNAECLTIIGSGEQAERHIEAITVVKNIKQINLWSRNQQNALDLANKLQDKYSISLNVFNAAIDAVKEADILCTVTSSSQPVISFDWIKQGAHINAVGACTPNAQEIDSATMINSKLYCDCYDSVYNEPGDFVIPFKKGLITKDHVIAELGEVIAGTKPGRQNRTDITLYKSLGIASEDIFSAYHIYKKLNAQ
jgi:ornithine cyclodeaminase